MTTSAAGVTVRSGQHLTPLPQAPSPVPAQYQSDYRTVVSQLQAFERAARTTTRKGSSTTVGAELLAANGNIGAALLTPRAISSVAAELDGFRALGVRGVTVEVGFPLLLPSTPGSAGYLSFYERVAKQVRSRGMVLSVEENPLFVGTPVTSVPISYAGLTLASYAAAQRQEAQIIVDRLKPKYLSILTEPDTFAALLHLPLLSPAAVVQVVNDELSGLHRRHVEVGAGTGTWTDAALDRALLAHTSIDYLDVHIYPLATYDLANLATAVAAAHAARKRLVMDEAWLYKDFSTGSFDLGGTIHANRTGAANELKATSYSFWEPLDERYVAAVVNYVRSRRFAYVSFFDGARSFFGYLTWSPQLEAASYADASRQYNQLVSGNLERLAVSGTGLALRDALSGHRKGRRRSR